jgi:histidyl-tRNA synthetase
MRRKYRPIAWGGLIKFARLTKIEMKPSLPQGTRDFNAEVVRKRQHILNTIRQEFELFGYAPLETPAFENMETLLGKYGEEGDKLIFKILNNGLEQPQKHEKAQQGLAQVMQGKNSTALTERALKYDLTIPFARYVAMNFGQLTMPFKRYQIQPVWRADRPQRGRYREFYQCDADVVGSNSLWNEIELVQLYKNVFQKLEVRTAICINNRKILAALALYCGGEEYLIPITVAIDKLDKIGTDGVLQELRTKALSEENIERIKTYLQISALPSNEEKIQSLHDLFSQVEIGQKGLSELEYVLQSHPDILLDVTLARGLNYYTGTILEVKPQGIEMGSIGGGGRYDDLTSLFGVPNISGVGISFGVDRIYDVMAELNLFPTELQHDVAVMLVNFGTEFQDRNREILNFLRTQHIACELYPEPIKFDKQLKYANKKQVGFVILIGETELTEGLVTIKNFKTGEQKKITMEELAIEIPH